MCDLAIADRSADARLTKAYDVTKLKKIQDSEMHIMRCMGSKLF